MVLMMFDRGSGPALIVVPGVQGRWEWMSPALEALSRSCRTISYTLSGDLGSGIRYEREGGFENYMRQLDEVVDAAGLERVGLCGVSYGGFIALRYAATRPQRVSSLTLVSAPAPGWTPLARQQRYIAHPWRSTPGFVVTGPLRLWPEIRSACPTWRSRITFSARHAVRVITAPMIPSVMAARVRLQQRLDFAPDCARLPMPVLVVTGEEELDRVVPVEATRRYLALIPGAQYVRMDRTGHIGMLTQPDRFAELVSAFVSAADRDAPAARRKRS